MGMAASFVMWPRSFEQAFVPLSQGGSIWNLASIGLVVIAEKKFKNIEYGILNMGDCTEVSQWPWPLILVRLYVLI